MTFGRPHDFQSLRASSIVAAVSSASVRPDLDRDEPVVALRPVVHGAEQVRRGGDVGDGEAFEDRRRCRVPRPPSRRMSSS